MKKRLLSLTIFFVLLTLPFVFAEGTIILGKQTKEATISPLGEASFTVTVKNPRGVQDIFMLEIPDVSWSIRTQQTGDYTTGVALGPYEAANTTIYVKPNENIEPGTHYVELRARSLNVGGYTSDLFAVNIDPKVVDYSITIPVEVMEPTSIDPQKSNSVKVLVKNPYPVYLVNITISASSKFLNKKTIIDVPPNSEKIVEFTLNLEDSTPQQEDNVKVTVIQNGNEIGAAGKTIYIKEFRQPFKTEEIITESWLETIHQITFTNTEAVQKTRDAYFAKPSTYAILVTKPSAVETTFDNAPYLMWKDVTLTPNESYSVYVIEDYRPLAGVVLVIIIIIVLYFVYRSPIIVNKKAYGLRKKDTGSNEIKVILHVKNRTRRFIEKVRVLERLPIIHKVEPDFGPETPEPKFRRAGTDGVVLDWDITLAPKEERIFTYRIKSALPIVGEYTLKPCVVQYGKKNRRTASPPYRLIID